ncbi:hypothetical protein BDV23DRAFT_186660 [Aspergillus alliaceus]|uniref:Uncharacterized protein n=1 Tax=Petromyces alliaceus TaxID=209559 RepID=A0A5N7C016_PETAA|nr:hypothetical protein BDV23DRAFT_186660 [Aspergillus alliaceus]
MTDNTPRAFAPDCLVSIVVENHINDIGNHLDLARGELQVVKNALHIEGPLRGDPGARLSPAENHSPLDDVLGQIRKQAPACYTSLPSLQRTWLSVLSHACGDAFPV